jgi:hypothetical protein
MADRLRFHPRVAEDLREATRWYDDISVDLGNRFRSQVNARLDDVTERPDAFALTHDPIPSDAPNRSACWLEVLAPPENRVDRVKTLCQQLTKQFV